MTDNDQATPDERPADSVASPAENAELTHTDENAPATTRDDRLDAGVPMTQGEPGTTTPAGPEDALGAEPTRGDYAGRVDAGPHLASVPIPEDERGPAVRHVDRATGEERKAASDKTIAVPNERPNAKLVEQTAN